MAEEEEKVPEDIEESSLKKEEIPKELEKEPSEEGYSCPECEKTFDTEEGLRSHIGQIHPEYYGKEEEEGRGNGSHTETKKKRQQDFSRSS